MISKHRGWALCAQGFLTLILAVPILAHMQASWPELPWHQLGMRWLTYTLGSWVVAEALVSWPLIVRRRNRG